MFEFQEFSLSKFLNKKFRSKEDLRRKSGVVSLEKMRQSVDNGIEARMLLRLTRCRHLIHIYEGLFNDILRGEISGGEIEKNLKDLDQRTSEHVVKIVEKLTEFIKNMTGREKIQNISMLNMEKEWENEGLEIEFLKNEVKMDFLIFLLKFII